MKALCETCGSINIVRAHSTPMDRLVGLLTGKQPFLCRRCGWRARRNWTDNDVQDLLAHGVDGAETDPTLSALDGDQPFAGHRKRRSESAPERDFDVSALGLNDPIAGAHWPVEEHPSEKAPGEGRRHRSRRRSGRRRAIAAVIGTAALILFLVIIFRWTGR